MEKNVLLGCKKFPTLITPLQNTVPCVFMPKRNGEIRISIDYRKLNKRTDKNSNPLPLPDEVQDRLGNAQVFTKLDCRKGFWQ